MALEHEPKAADRLRMVGRSAVPRTALVNFLYVAGQAQWFSSCALVSAFHMLTHPQEFEMSLIGNEDDGSRATEHWLLTFRFHFPRTARTGLSHSLANESAFHMLRVRAGTGPAQASSGS